jgi:hypothetical protein
MRAHWQRFKHEERGIALVFAVVALAALSASVVTISYISTQSQSQSNAGKAQEVAYHFAESGLSEAVAIVANTAVNDPSDPNLLPPMTPTPTGVTCSASTTAPITLPYTGGTVSYSGCLDNTGNDAIWYLKSVATAPNPAVQGADITRTLKASIIINLPAPATNVDPTHATSWGYVIAKSNLGGDNCDQSVGVNSIRFPYFIAGNLCMNYTSSTVRGVFGPLNSSVSTLQVKGHVAMDPGSGASWPSIGTGNTSSTTVYKFDAGLGCRLNSATGVASFASATPAYSNANCTNANHIFPRASTTTNAPVSLWTPDVDTATWDKYYNRAAPGPNHPCVTAGGKSYTTPAGNALPAFESSGNTARDNSATALNLTPAYSYVCYSNKNGILSWDNTNKRLTVKGTTFIDGSAYISNGAAIATTTTNCLFSGTCYGTLYLSGSFLLSNSSKLCVAVSGGACDSSPWWGSLFGIGSLVVAANGSGSTATTPNIPAGDSIYLTTNTQFQGYMYGTNTIELDSGVVFQGPIVSNNQKWNGAFTMNSWTAPVKMPSGSPGENPDNATTVPGAVTGYSG